MNYSNPGAFGLSVCVILCTTWVAARAEEKPLAAPVLQKPSWLTELSLGIRETYDDNVFVSGVDRKNLTPPSPVPAGSVAALENRSSWVTTVSPKMGFNFAPLLDEKTMWSALSLTYAPDLVVYHDQRSESYNAHRVVGAIKGQRDAFSVKVDNTFSYIDGNRFGPVYPGALYNAYMNSSVRERREQIQDKAAVSLQYDWKHFFVRPTASFVDYDLMTAQLNVTGYQSFVDRYDVNGGADAGFKVSPSLAFTVGYRYGHQYQQTLAYSPYSSPSDYQRLLFGLEGKPWSWLNVSIQAGPDFREYPGNTATHLTPVNDLRPVKYYGEAVLTATLTTRDALTFKYKQWQWVSSTGKVPYFDSSFDLGYHRQLTGKLGLDLGGKILSSDYTSGNLAACRRNDWEYVVSTGLGYAFSRCLSASLAYELDLGRNALDDLVNDQTRSFHRDLVSLSALWKF